VEITPKVGLRRTVWSNYFWPTGHFTKTWKLADHFQQIDAQNKRFKIEKGR